MSKATCSSKLSRGDFLKLAGLSALVPLLGSITSASAAEIRLGIGYSFADFSIPLLVR